jgi:periplasmic protein TonB
MLAAMRFPFAAGSGVLFSLTIFFVLWHFVSRPIDIGPPVDPLIINFTPQIKPVPPESKRMPKVERESPVLEPNRPTIGPHDTTIGPPTLITRPENVRVAGGGGFRLQGSDRDVLPLVRVEPAYPPRAVEQNIEGWVQVQYSVTAIGTVRDVTVIASEPGTTFDDAAVKAVARWRYNPRIDGGVAVERVGMQTVIRFTLEE